MSYAFELPAILQDMSLKFSHVYCVYCFFSFLQAEISDLKEQVIMYESASQYGVFQNGSSMQSKLSSIKNVDSIMDDSYAQLGIKRTQSSAR